MYFRLKDFDPKKLNQSKFKDDVREFMTLCGQLFDILCTDKAQIQKLETAHKLKMKEWDTEFYQDQKTDRKMVCEEKQETRSKKSDERFKRDLDLAQKRAEKQQ